MTDPVFSDEWVNLYHGDCRTIMQQLPSESVDAIVTDPPYELGFMGKQWDDSGIAYSHEVWSQALRVLKPGGHLLAFGGTRTWHRLAVAIEDAGLEIRDSIAWMYGSGFPKSLDVAKSIENKLTTGSAAKNGFHALNGKKLSDGGIGLYDSVEAHGFRKKQPQQHGTRTLDATTDEALQWQGWGTALKPAHEPIVVARKPLIGTVAENVLAHGTGALNIDGCRIAGEPWQAVAPNSGGRSGGVMGKQTPHPGGEPHTAGRWPANVILDESQATALDTQTNALTSRFFYVAKANKTERPREGDTAHPTVKPINLMRHLVRLVAPPNGVILDPFTGSGTTLEACFHEGLNAIGIEITDDYIPLINQRLNRCAERGLF